MTRNYRRPALGVDIAQARVQCLASLGGVILVAQGREIAPHYAVGVEGIDLQRRFVIDQGGSVSAEEIFRIGAVFIGLGEIGRQADGKDVIGDGALVKSGAGMGISAIAVGQGIIRLAQDRLVEGGDRLLVSIQGEIGVAQVVMGLGVTGRMTVAES